ncbi:hypothetical protein HK407_04g06670 [Ordospora pajunii]|uniref:uncharacterized protein n=1 Tax=Ordospora pajunii TaxID=3039483 RepID=UPI0029528B87|nr:uncharacterized protein HK407_04g06670 [Ordospora pajunii]KAH9411563.1 hypothetical protein HK407_04g06670 [Ordospora pajunii]
MAYGDADSESVGRAVEQLRCALKSEYWNASSLVIEALECIAACAKKCKRELKLEWKLDDMIVDAFNRTDEADRERFVLLLPDLVFCMRDPRNIYPSIERYFVPGFLFCFDVAELVFLMKKDFGYEFEGFFRNLLCCMNPMTMGHHIEKRLMLVMLVIEDKSSTLATVKAIIKKLCSISLLMRSADCHKILWTVLWIMRLHPMTYSMARAESFVKELEWTSSIIFNEFQPYLFELDILSESVKGIRNVIRQIKDEACDIKKRPRFITFTNFMFPELEI